MPPARGIGRFWGPFLDSFRGYVRLFADRKLGADLKPKCRESDLVQRQSGTAQV